MTAFKTIPITAALVVTAENVNDLFTYDPNTGEIRWKVTVGRKMHAGDLAGSDNGMGYRRIGFKGKFYKAHRIAWLMSYGTWPKQYIDHINGNKSDNRIKNLRDVSPAENSQNMRRPSIRNTSGFIGAHFDASSGSWRSVITTNGTVFYLGNFGTAEEAHAAYLAAKREQHSTCTI